MKYSGYISSTGTCLSADAANWAQASGKLQQNIVIPYIPSPARPHWTARYGAAAVVVRNNTNEVRSPIAFRLAHLRNITDRSILKIIHDYFL